MGRKKPKSTLLRPADKANVVEFRRRTQLPLDDVLGCLRNTIPNLSCSALHRCLQRHGIPRLPAAQAAQTRKHFKAFQIGHGHIDNCRLRHTDGILIKFFVIDRVSKFTDVAFRDRSGKMEGTASFRSVMAAFLDSTHTVLTDNGMAFAELPENRTGPNRWFLAPHIFDRVCIEHGIEHRPIKAYHLWTNGQAKRMNQTIKAPVKVVHYEDLASLMARVLAFVTAYNFAEHRKGLRSKTPLPTICHAWTNDPDQFRINPHHLNRKRYT